MNTHLWYIKMVLIIEQFIENGIYLSIYLYTYKTLITLFVWLFEAVHTNPGYGMAALIYNNLLNLILGTVIFLRSS